MVAGNEYKIDQLDPGAKREVAKTEEQYPLNIFLKIRPTVIIQRSLPECLVGASHG